MRQLEVNKLDKSLWFKTELHNIVHLTTINRGSYPGACGVVLPLDLEAQLYNPKISFYRKFWLRWFR